MLADTHFVEGAPTFPDRLVVKNLTKEEDESGFNLIFIKLQDTSHEDRPVYGQIFSASSNPLYLYFIGNYLLIHVK